MQLLIGKHADFAGLALPDDGGLVLAPCIDVAVKAVVRQVELAADEPFCPGTIPFEDFVPLFEPVQLTGDAPPELLGIVDRLLIEALIFGETLDVSLLAELRWTLEFALLLQNRINVGLNSCILRHRIPRALKSSSAAVPAAVRRASSPAAPATTRKSVDFNSLRRAEGETPSGQPARCRRYGSRPGTLLATTRAGRRCLRCSTPGPGPI